jgi:hypothetical protein
MEKMNFSFLRLNSRMALPILLFLGLFLTAFSVNAQHQYVTPAAAKVIIDKHMNDLPALDYRPRSIQVDAQGMAEVRNGLRHGYGQTILQRLNEGDNVEQAIEWVFNMLKNRYQNAPPKAMENVNLVKQEYVNLLKA